MGTGLVRRISMGGLPLSCGFVCGRVSKSAIALMPTTARRDNLVDNRASTEGSVVTLGNSLLLADIFSQVPRVGGHPRLLLFRAANTLDAERDGAALVPREQLPCQFWRARGLRDGVRPQPRFRKKLALMSDSCSLARPRGEYG